MNIENVKRCIAVMKRVAAAPDHKFNMSYWFSNLGTATLHSRELTEEKAVECGTSACFLGWLALAPEIPEIYVSPHTGAIFGNGGGCNYNALADFLEVPRKTARVLCGLPEEAGEDFIELALSTNPQDVIDLLEKLIEERQQ